MNEEHPHVTYNNKLLSLDSREIAYAKEMQKWSTCNECPLSRCRNKVVFAGGNPFKSKIAIIGEAPGPDEDIVGIPFIGKSGKLVREILTKLSIDPNDIYWTNSLGCIPRDIPNGNFRSPKPLEYLACRPRLQFIWDNYLNNMSAIILLGSSAFVGLLSMISSQDEAGIVALQKKTKMSENLGWHIFDKLPKIYLTYHPSYIERQGRPKPLLQSWVNDFKSVRHYLDSGEIKCHENNRGILHHA